MGQDAKNGIRMIAIYGKAGIGKSTVSSNLSAALSTMGEKVMQVGCDPKRDSIATLCGKLMPTLLDEVRGKVVGLKEIESVIFKGYNDILGIECGGPHPGKGCAGKGVDLALELLSRFNIFEKKGASFVIFDVLGDVVCGGFSKPMRSGYAKEMYQVVSGEVLTLYQANSIFKAVTRLSDLGVEVGIAGLINNMRGMKDEEKIVEDFASAIGIPVTYHIPRSKTVQDAEFDGKTVIEAYPESEQADRYRELAKKIQDNKDKPTHIPKNILSLGEIWEIAAKYV